MKDLKHVIFSVVILTLVAINVLAQSGGTFTITKSVIAGGGGRSTGGTFIMDGSIGQPFGGATSTGGTFSLTSGFWSPEAAPSPTPAGAIGGNVSYAIITKPVPGVLLNASGSVPVMSMTDATGAYNLTGLGTGPYSVVPSKPTQGCGLSNGIFASDASQVSQFVVGLRTFTPDQTVAAKVAGGATITAADASLIARRIVGLCATPPNLAGQWVFMPNNVMYPEVQTTINGENYTAIMMGDVDGDWNPLGPNRPILDLSDDSDAITASLPTAVAQQGSVLNIPLSINKLDRAGVYSYQFDIEYDPQVIEPAEIAADLAGTIGESLTIVYNVPLAGLLKIAVYGPLPVTGDGTYVNLRFNVKGASAASSPLTIHNPRVNETPAIRTVNGAIKVAAAPAEGRLLRQRRSIRSAQN